MNHRSRTLTILASLTLVGTAYGCSSSSSSGDDSSATPDGGGTGSDGGGSDGSGGGGGEGGGGGGTKVYAGNVTANPDLGIAVFLKDPGSNSCVTTSGSCTLYNCPTGDAGDVPTYSAGDITLTGGKLSSPVVLHFDADGGTYGAKFASAAFAAGDTLSVSAAGGDVSPFSGSTGTGPGPITLTAPTGTGTAGFQDYTLDTTKDLTVTWTGGTAGTQVAFSLSNDDDDSTHLELSCTFDGAGGTGTVPAALLAQLGNPSDGTLQADPISTTTVTGDNVSVKLQLTNNGTIGTWTKQ